MDARCSTRFVQTLSERRSDPRVSAREVQRPSTLESCVFLRSLRHHKFLHVSDNSQLPVSLIGNTTTGR